jgi:hypothetical protein
MNPVKCPECGAKLAEESTACSNCPWSLPEEDPTASGNPLRHSPYYQFLLPVTFFGLLAYAVWSIGIGLMRLGEAGTRSETPDPLRPRIAATARSGVQAPTAGTAMVSLLPPDDNAEPLGGAVIVAPLDVHASVASRAARDWRLRGTVLDLTTLKPVSGCEMLLTDPESSRTIRTRTDSQGRYRLLVPALAAAGYRVAIVKEGYAANYLESSSTSARSMSGAKRSDMARDLATRLTAETTNLHAVGAAPLVTDFFLAPKR